MKRTLSVLLALALLLCATASLAEPAEEENTFQWGAYELRVIWVTTDRDEIGLRDLREDGLFVMLRLEGVGGPVQTADIQALQGDEFVLVDTKGEKSTISTLIYHQFGEKTADSIFPLVADEQDSFDVLYFLEGKNEADAAGLQLFAGDVTIDLDSIPRELPAEEAE